jgi:gluconolactonase
MTTRTNSAPPESLRAVLADGATVEKVAGGYQFTEGPVYHAPTDSVIFSDIPADTLFRYGVASRAVETYRKPSGNANGNTLDREGRLLSCEHGNRRVSRTEADGMVVTLAYAHAGKRLNSPNDLVVKSDGTLYFTDPPYGLPDQKVGKELDFSGVYRIDRAGSLTLLFQNMPRPNGLAFSPDEKTLYVADSQEQHLLSAPVLPDGTTGPTRLHTDMRDPAKPGAPDGLKVDRNGVIFCTGAGGVWVIAPDGKTLGVIPTPEVPTNCCFGDRDGKTLYVTAQTSLYRVRLRAPGPLPGKKK